jgi:hypothetical protein
MQRRTLPAVYSSIAAEEREWWQERNVDPLAAALWQKSRERHPVLRQ